MVPGRKLLVEGPGDQRVISALAEKLGIRLKLGPEKYLVQIDHFDGVSQLLNPAVLRAEAQSSDLTCLGLVLDADENPDQRLARLREACRAGLGIELPVQLPRDGWINEAAPRKPRFGLWMMPDNASRGMLETFLAYLLPPSGGALWDWTDSVCDQAKEKGATFKEVQRDKARIHAYLAFQDEPGRQLHEALINRLLNPNHEMARRFFSWFCRLFELTPAKDSGHFESAAT